MALDNSLFIPCNLQDMWKLIKVCFNFVLENVKHDQMNQDNTVWNRYYEKKKLMNSLYSIRLYYFAFKYLLVFFY